MPDSLVGHFAAHVPLRFCIARKLRRLFCVALDCWRAGG